MALEVIFDGDIAPLNKKIKEAEHNLQDFANEKAYRIKLGLDTVEVDKNIKSVKTELNSLKTTLRDTGNSFQKDFAPKVANGSNAMTQFNRIIQDAPFGPMGVQNNITAFGEAFGYLVKETGSAKLAFGAMVGSLVGSGGVMLAISAVTSGLTYMAQKGLTVGDVFKQITGDFDEARKSMQDLSVETAKNAQAQISSLGAYVSVAKNINLSMNDRLIAVKKLQAEYPAYFGNLTKEQILNGNVADAVRGVTAALIAKAKAAALTDRIVKLAEEEEKIQNSINNSIAAQFKQYRLTKQEAFDAAVILNKQLRGEIDLEKELTEGRANSLTKAEKTALAAYKYSKTLQGLGGELQSNIYQQDRLTSSLEKSYAASIKLEQQQEKAGKKKLERSSFISFESSIDDTGLQSLVSLSGMAAQVAKNVQGYEGVISTSLSKIPGYFNTAGQQSLLELQNFNKAMSDIIKGGIADTLAGLGDAIGTAFTNGQNIISAVGKSLLSTLGGVLVELGKMAITTGIGILAIQTALKSLNPYVAIAAGVALVALGSAVKGGVKNLGSSASSGGGASTGNISTGASYSSPASGASSNTGTSSFGGGTVVFEISGQKLIGVLSNTLDANTKLGGTLGLT